MRIERAMEFHSIPMAMQEEQSARLSQGNFLHCEKPFKEDNSQGFPSCPMNPFPFTPFPKGNNPQGFPFQKKKSALRGAFEWTPFPKSAAGQGNGKGEWIPSRFFALRFARVRFEPLSGRSFKGNGRPLGFQRCASRERDGPPLRGWFQGEWILFLFEPLGFQRCPSGERGSFRFAGSALRDWRGPISIGMDDYNISEALRASLAALGRLRIATQSLPIYSNVPI